MNPSRDFTLSTYVEVVRRQWLLVIVAGIVCAVAAVGFSLLEKKTYTAVATVAVTDPNASSALIGSGGFISAATPLQLSAVAASQVTRPEVITRVQEVLGRRRGTRSRLTRPGAVATVAPWSYSRAALRRAVTTTIDPNSYLLYVTATAPTAEAAQKIANTFANVDIALTTAEARANYARQAASLAKTMRGSKSETVKIEDAATLSRLEQESAIAAPLQLSSPATTPSSPSSPKPTRNGLAGLALGLLLGIALAVVRDATDRRIRRVEDVVNVLPLPIVGHIRAKALGHTGRPDLAGGKTRGALEAFDEESFRILRQNTGLLVPGHQQKTVLVTSGTPEEGKSTVSSCLAVAAAAAGQRTLLVECDLRRPVLAERLGIRSSPGLTDYLAGSCRPQDALQLLPSLPTPQAPGAQSYAPVCIPAGTSAPQPAALLESDAFKRFLGEVSAVYDLVILDTAPLLPVADTLAIAPLVSTVLLCVRVNHATRGQAGAVKATLDRLGVPTVGVVLTGLTDRDEEQYGNYYRSYRYELGDAEHGSLLGRH
jgi:capsular exopolysaccharide synthesis family protein